MITFAELDENLKVKRVIVISEANNADGNGAQDENVGIAFCKKLYGEDTIWRQAGGKRGLTGKGKMYHAGSDSFIESQPFASWILQSVEYDGGSELQWGAPVEKPSLTEEQIDLGYCYSWNEPLYQDNPESADVWELYTPQIIGITDEPSDTTVSIGSSAIIGIGLTINYGIIMSAAAEKYVVDDEDPEIGQYWNKCSDLELYVEENSIRTGILTSTDVSGDIRLTFFGDQLAISGTTTSFTLTVNE
jgi:hypothetical protein